MRDEDVKTPTAGRPTIRDVASLAGISTAAAARALNGYGYASPELRAAAKRAATQLGYEPNRAAQSIKTRRTRTIGVVGADISNPYFSAAMRGIADAATEAGYQALLANTDESVVKERAAIRAFVRHRVDGIVVSPADAGDVDHLLAVRKHGIPVVLLDRDPPEMPGDRVIVDGTGAAEEAVSRLLAMGHRVGIIAELSGEREWQVASASPSDQVDTRSLTSSGARLYGYLRAHWRAGSPVEPSLIVRTGTYTSESALLATRGLLASPVDARPTALFTVDNVMSLGAYEAILESGLSVPDDLSIIAFDDVEWMRLVKPRIVAVAQPAAEMGRMAAELLQRRIRDGGEDYVRQIVPVTFTSGASVAPPRTVAAS